VANQSAANTAEVPVLGHDVEQTSRNDNGGWLRQHICDKCLAGKAKNNK
jgi:hypothetical protein